MTSTMAPEKISSAHLLNAHDPFDTSIAVLTGFGIAVTVSRGHLVLRDGVGRQRRERRLPRAQRNVRRVVILGQTGHVSLEAIQWCLDTGVGLVQIDPTTGALLMHAARNGRDDARLRRAQVLAAGTDTGLAISQSLIDAKLRGHAATLERHGFSPTTVASVRKCADDVNCVNRAEDVRDIEAQGANQYFGAWAGRVTARFADNDARHMPQHWDMFAARGSILHRGGRSPRGAADPINALLNYGYALAEIECTLAARALGLDPGLGFLHTDQPHRDSLALDLIEPLRPIVDDLILQLLNRRVFTRTDFVETRTGGCRLSPALASELAGHLADLAPHAARHAEHVAHLVGHSSTATIQVRTPLTRQRSKLNTSAATRPVKGRGPKAPLVTNTDPETAGTTRAAATCRTCGTPLENHRRKLCPGCWNVTRRQLATDRARTGNASLAALRATTTDPTTSPAAVAKKATSLSATKRKQLAWEPTQEEASLEPSWFTDIVRPGLQDIPLRLIQGATGLSIASASRIRSGSLTPHRRHWLSLATLTAAGRPVLSE